MTWRTVISQEVRARIKALSNRELAQAMLRHQNGGSELYLKMLVAELERRKAHANAR